MQLGNSSKNLIGNQYLLIFGNIKVLPQHNGAHYEHLLERKFWSNDRVMVTTLPKNLYALIRKLLTNYDKTRFAWKFTFLTISTSEHRGINSSQAVHSKGRLLTAFTKTFIASSLKSNSFKTIPYLNYVEW